MRWLDRLRREKSVAVGALTLPVDAMVSMLGGESYRRRAIEKTARALPPL